MWSLTSPRAECISSLEKFRSSVKKDSFNTIRQKQTSAGAVCTHRGRSPSRTSSKSFHGPVTNHSKVDPADQIRTEHLGGAHSGHRLSQRTDVRSERHDSAYHHGNRSEGSDLIGS